MNEGSNVYGWRAIALLRDITDKSQELSYATRQLLLAFENDESKEGKMFYRRIKDDLIDLIDQYSTNLKKIQPLIDRFAKLQKTRDLNTGKFK